MAIADIHGLPLAGPRLTLLLQTLEPVQELQYIKYAIFSKQNIN
jgi:hypothetical protein